MLISTTVCDEKWKFHQSRRISVEFLSRGKNTREAAEVLSIIHQCLHKKYSCLVTFPSKFFGSCSFPDLKID
jgi:hypothetical protein